MHKKIVIIGAGHVGSHCAYSLCVKGVCDEIVFIDKDAGKALANANDVADAVGFCEKDTYVRAGGYEDLKDADIAVISIGTPRRKGQTRLEMLDASIVVAKDVIGKIKSAGFGGIMVTITNPADIIADYFRKNLNLPRSRCFSTGTSLDSARMKRVLASALGVSPKNIGGCCIGEHGNSSVIPFSSVKVSGQPLDRYEREHKEITLDRDFILEETRQIGNRVIDGKGSTEFGIGALFADMAACILEDKKEVMPASVLLKGEYGLYGVHAGVPCIIGKSGAERILEIPLTDGEKEAFIKSCEIIKAHIKRAEKI